MMENRSFDHMLGYLSLDPANGLPVDGLKADPAWAAAVANPVPPSIQNPIANPQPPYPFAETGTISSDLPHNYNDIDAQINTPGPDGLKGFIATYAQSVSGTTKPVTDPKAVRVPMSYQTADTVPTYDFLARNFVVCDHWHAALPAGTQPNRLMFMSGHSDEYTNGATQLAATTYVYDWLDGKADWGIYHAGHVPFVALDPHWRWRALVSDGRIKPYLNDQDAGAAGGFDMDWGVRADMPKVIFIDPAFQDDPFAAADEVCDDHPASGVGPGQAFLAGLYNTLISNPERWKNTLLIITYDEHGGFFDHVPPLPLTHPSICGDHPFTTNGVRVPALLASPWLDQGKVFTAPLDHTAILQMLADRFVPDATGKGTYSAEVSDRQVDLSSVKTLLDTVGLAAPRTAFNPIPIRVDDPQGPYEPDEQPDDTPTVAKPTDTALAQGFQLAGEAMKGLAA